MYLAIGIISFAILANLIFWRNKSVNRTTHYWKLVVFNNVSIFVFILLFSPNLYFTLAFSFILLYNGLATIKNTKVCTCGKFLKKSWAAQEFSCEACKNNIPN